MVRVTVWIMGIQIVFNDASGDLLIVNLCIGIIFTIFLCNFTIIDEIKNIHLKEHK